LQTESSPLNEIPNPPPPPPPTSITKDFRLTPSPPPPPPPPLPMMTTGMQPFRSEAQETSKGSSLEGKPVKKVPKTYERIPITEEILKSVVLKPIGNKPL